MVNELHNVVLYNKQVGKERRNIYQLLNRTTTEKQLESYFN